MSLPRRVCELWSELSADEPYPLACLGTCDELGARVRTLVVRDFDPEAGRLTFFGHRQHDKWSQLDRLGEACVAGGPRATPLQLRFRCRLSLAGEERQSWWQRLPAAHRLRLYKLDQPQPPEEFLILRADVVEVDLLDLRVPIRYGYVLEDGAYREVLRLE